MTNLWDIHNHILPGVDDGSSCMEETEVLVELEYEQGVRNVVLTPHCREGMFEVSSEDRLEIYKDTVRVISQSFPDMNIYLGCEMYMMEKSLKLLDNPVNRMNGSMVVLMEFDYGVEFSLMLKFISSVLARNYKPIIAHAERYDCLKGGSHNLDKLRDMGCYIQVNADAVIGRNGFKTKFLVAGWLKEGKVDLVASDAHSVKGRTVRLKKAYDNICKRCGAEVAKQLFQTNASALFGRNK